MVSLSGESTIKKAADLPSQSKCGRERLCLGQMRRVGGTRWPCL